MEDVIALSGIPPGGRILEIGCGTGQATIDFARRGFLVTGLEPGPALARLARERLAAFPHVTVLPCTFEEWPLETGACDLIISAQAFHWIAPEVRFVKSAEALRAAGALAVFGNAVAYDRSPLRRSLNQIYEPFAPWLNKRVSPKWYADQDIVRQLFGESGRFGSVTSRNYPWSREYSSDDYLDLLRTHSDHRLLPQEQHDALLDAVRQTIDNHGGTITVQYEAHLYVASKAHPQATAQR